MGGPHEGNKQSLADMLGHAAYPSLSAYKKKLAQCSSRTRQYVIILGRIHRGVSMRVYTSVSIYTMFFKKKILITASERNLLFFWWDTHTRSNIHAYTHLYKRTHKHLRETESKKLIRQILRLMKPPQVPRYQRKRRLPLKNIPSFNETTKCQIWNLNSVRLGMPPS
jgi:hypothetical protein